MSIKFTPWTLPKNRVQYRLIDDLLWVVDADGNPVKGGLLLSIDEDGTLRLKRGIDPSLGLPLDEFGCLRTATF